jgi:hypothetical protein
MIVTTLRVAAEAIAGVPHVARVYTREQLLLGAFLGDLESFCSGRQNASALWETRPDEGQLP